MSTNSLEQLLTTIAPPLWHTRQAVILDWYDGPREGFCALDEPNCEFYFKLFAEMTSSDDLDDRLFRLYATSCPVLDDIVSSLSVLGQPFRPCWIPIWRFPDERLKSDIESRIDDIIRSSEVTDVIIRTTDMVKFSNIWLLMPDSAAKYW
jgi:hypothetical protein